MSSNYSISNEFKVGIFVLVATAIVILSYRWVLDGVKPDERSYVVFMRVPTADGMWEGTPVRMAGVEVGGIKDIQVDGDRARLTLEIREQYELPTDTTGSITSSGMLGERFIALQPGTDKAVVPEQGVIQLGSEPGDLDEIMRQVEDIAGDIKVVTAELAEIADNDDNREALEATLQNVEQLTEELALIASQNHRDINEIVDAIERLTTTLADASEETAKDIDVEMEKIHELTDTMQSTMDDLESITGKIDDGEGTLGALVNDDETIDALNDTIESVNEVVESFSGLRAEVYYEGRYYYGTQPTDPQFFYGNPLHGGGANTIGINLRPQEDFWWIFEVNDYPQGTVTYTEHFFAETGEHYREYERQPNFRLTFMMSKRWRNTSFRLGIKENGGGIGMSQYLFDDALEVKLDVFDFDLGSYPAVASSGLPNSRVLVRYSPMRNLYFDVGSEQILLGVTYDYYTFFAGGGFSFTDDDIKLLLATLPLGI